MAEVVVGTEELMEKLRGMSEAAQGRALANIVLAGADVVVNAAKKNVKSQGLMRTRNLSRSVHGRLVEISKDHATVEVGTNLEYAAIHEFGGTIQAKTRKYLAVPTGNRGGSPLKHSDLRVRKTAGGNLVMVDDGGTVQYVLKRSVSIPARPYLRPAVDESKAMVENVMTEAFRRVVSSAAK